MLVIGWGRVRKKKIMDSIITPIVLKATCRIGLMVVMAVSAIGTGCSDSSKTSADHPNIVIIFADDLGYGDVGCYNPESRIPTPNIDSLAQQGIRFMDAHSADSVCTPSRYGLLTGRYCWRGKLKTGVLFNWEPPLIEQGRTTIASLLKHNGYRTAISGKWHLGLGFTAKEGMRIDFNKPLPWPPGPEPDRSISESIDLSAPVFGGPETLGLDETYYTAGCSTDQEPFCFIENGFLQHMEAATYRNPYGSW